MYNTAIILLPRHSRAGARARQVTCRLTEGGDIQGRGVCTGVGIGRGEWAMDCALVAGSTARANERGEAEGLGCERWRASRSPTHRADYARQSGALHPHRRRSHLTERAQHAAVLAAVCTRVRGECFVVFSDYV